MSFFEICFLLYFFKLSAGHVFLRNIVSHVLLMVTKAAKYIVSKLVIVLCLFRVLDLVEIVIKKQPCSGLILVSIS